MWMFFLQKKDLARRLFCVHMGHERKVFVQMRQTAQADSSCFGCVGIRVLAFYKFSDAARLQSTRKVYKFCSDMHLPLSAHVMACRESIRYDYRAQLVGLDVASLVKEIKERVQTVSQNKEDCELLAERAELILDLLGRLQKSKVIEDPDMWKPTERLRSTLRRACEVIEFCRERSCTYRFCKSDHTAKELRKVLKALKFCVTHLTALVTIINGDQTTRYFLVQQTPDVVQLQDGVLAPALGLPAQHFKYNDRNDRGETLGISGKAQLVTEPSSVNEPGLKRFAFSQLEVATDNFSLENQIGVGAFSIVYQGQLNEGLEVAVKRASYVDKIPFHQLENELDLIPKLQHTNMRVFTVLEERRYQIQVVHYAPSNGCKGLETCIHTISISISRTSDVWFLSSRFFNKDEHLGRFAQVKFIGEVIVETEHHGVAKKELQAPASSSAPTDRG
uniref:Protein kinase domain containing protein-like n=1 Tax=Oryza glaberrima TaxID=4538 RepID=A0A679BAY8_ORYGL|nr:protein kinase domain containing protein-like [Oryza glaberrima]